MRKHYRRANIFIFEICQQYGLHEPNMDRDYDSFDSDSKKSSEQAAEETIWPEFTM